MSKSWMSCVIAAVFAIIAQAAAPVPVPGPGEFKFTDVQNKDDKASVEVVEGKTIIHIKCSRGIGHCKVTAKKGTWPEHVTLLLEGVGELEHFEFSFGRMSVQGSRHSSGKFTLYFLDDDLDFNKRSRVGTLDAKVEKRKDAIAVVFPGKLFAGADTVSFAWIDWLRR